MKSHPLRWLGVGVLWGEAVDCPRWTSGERGDPTTRGVMEVEDERAGGERRLAMGRTPMTNRLFISPN